MILVVKDKRWRNPHKIKKVLDRRDRAHLIVTGSQEIGDIADRLGFRVRHTRPTVANAARQRGSVLAFWEGHPIEPLGCSPGVLCGDAVSVESHDVTERKTGKRPIEFIDPMRNLLDQAFRADLDIEVVCPSTRI